MTTDTCKTLILGTSYISAGTEGAQNYGARVVKLWVDVALKLNPNAEVLIVDSASPGWDDRMILGDNRSSVQVYQFSDNVGHLNTTGRDGWGRALSLGVETATEVGYDYIAYIDCDNILALPITPMIEKMRRTGVKVSIPWDTTYNFLENGIMLLDVQYLKESRFVERYDWENRTRSADPMEIPEMVCERLFKDELFVLPIRTFRDDLNRLTVNNIEHFFPYGIDALTHVRDFAVYERFLAMKGIEL